MEEPLIEFMTIYGRGTCPICHSNLWVADAEISFVKLTAEGMPDPNSEQIINKVSAYCPNCGHKQPMVRWKGGYIPYDYTYLMQLLIEEDDARVRRTKALNSGKFDNPDPDYNPLAK